MSIWCLIDKSEEKSNEPHSDEHRQVDDEDYHNELRDVRELQYQLSCVDEKPDQINIE